jgi:hypothetical protein
MTTIQYNNKKMHWGQDYMTQIIVKLKARRQATRLVVLKGIKLIRARKICLDPVFMSRRAKL